MRNSSIAALSFSFAVLAAGCGDSEPDDSSNPGSTAGSSGSTAGSSSAAGSTSMAGKGGTAATGGSSAGGSNAGGSGTGGGSAGHGGSAGNAGSGGAGGCGLAPCDVQVDDADILVDRLGFALYVHVGDTVSTTNPASSCLFTCAYTWKPFLVEEPNVPAPLDAGDFRFFGRNDRAAQATYKGWPLYTYAQDEAEGDTTGDGVDGVWHVVKIPFVAPQREQRVARGQDAVARSRQAAGRSGEIERLIVIADPQIAEPLLGRHDFIESVGSERDDRPDVRGLR